MMEIQRELAERSLADFIRIGWRYIDPADYIGNWHIDAVCEHLEAVSRGQLRRLIINIPPRHMKSLSCSVAWPAWTWIQKAMAGTLAGPSTSFLAISYAHNLSIRDSVKCRRLIYSPWYQENWGDRFRLANDQDTKIRFDNDHQGYRICTSVEGMATGEGADIAIIDDAMSAGDANSKTAQDAVISWWDNVMPTRLNNQKTGAFAVIAQRLHERDIVGHILSKENRTDWTVLCLPARYEREHPHVWARDPRKEEGELLWPARNGEAEVKALETALGGYGAAGQLQQRPSPAGGGIFKAEWWKYFRPDALPVVRRIVQSWDTAFKTKTANDYSVCTTWAECENGYYLLDVWKQKVEFPDLKRMVVSKGAQWVEGHRVAAILVEDKASGQSLVQELRRDTTLPIVPIKVDQDKESRAYAVTPLIEGGRVFLPEGAPWLADFVASLSGFPNAAHDDDVDSLTQALAYMAREQVHSAGFLGMVRQQNAERAAAEQEVAAQRAAPVECPYPPGSVEFEQFMANA